MYLIFGDQKVRQFNIEISKGETIQHTKSGKGTLWKMMMLQNAFNWDGNDPNDVYFEDIFLKL